MSFYFHDPIFSISDFINAIDGDLQPTSGREVSRRRTGESQRSLTRGFQPRMDIHESPESNLVTAKLNLPGMKKEDINIDVRNGRLVVSGEQNESNEVKEEGYVLRERSFGRFERALPLPRGTQVSNSAFALL